MEIVLIRHGEPEWVVDGKNVVNPPLTERGHRQAAATAAVLTRRHGDGAPFDAVYVSPLLRARQTAAPLLTGLVHDEVVEPWLHEIQEPDWHGLPAELSAQAYAADRLRSSDDRWGGVDGGEAPRDFVQRVRTGCSDFLRELGAVRLDRALPIWSLENPDLRVAFVAHAGTNAVILSYLLDLAPVPWEWDRFVTNHASITRVETLAMGDGSSFSLSKLSEVEHLGPEDRTR